MARGVNKVILVGNLGQDPEVRYLSSGGAVANISIATTENWKDKQTGQQQDRTEWHRIVFFNRLAEIAGEYLNKGSQVYIEGKLKTRKWQDQSGQDRYTTEVVANDLQMLGGRANAGMGDDMGGYGQANMASSQTMQPPQPQAAGAQYQQGVPPQQPMSHQPAPQQPIPQQSAPQQRSQSHGMDSFDDDIPF